MPDRLQLEEGTRSPTGSARPALERTTRLTFSAASRSSSATGAVGAGDVDRVHVHVPGEPGRELVAEPGEDVDGAAGDVRGGERLGELDGGERVGLRGDGDDRVPADERREQP